MPITKREFEEGDFTVLRGKAFEVLEFLKANKEKAYVSKEIAEAVKLKNPISVNPILKKLIDEGLVEKKVPYYNYILKDDKKIIKDDRKVKTDEVSKEPIEDFEDEPVEPYEGEDTESEPYVETK